MVGAIEETFTAEGAEDAEKTFAKKRLVSGEPFRWRFPEKEEP
jgi:hypothetical protein